MDTTKHLNPLLELLMPKIAILDEVPDEFYSVDELCAMTGTALSTMRRKLNNLAREGKIKVVKVRRLSVGRGNFPIPYYGYVKP